MRSIEARAAFALVLAVAGSLLPAPAAAFWPFTREPRVEQPDSSKRARIASRYEDFRVGRDSLVSGMAVGGATDSAAAASATPTSTAAGVQYILRARDAAAEQTADTASPAFASPDSVTTTASPWGTPTDSLGALAGSDTLDTGPFPGLSGTGTPPPVDSAANAAAAAAALGRGFAPDFKSNLGSTNDNMRMTSDLSVLFNDPSGITLNSAMGYGVDISLTQNTDQRTTNLSNRLDMPLLQKSVRFGMSTMNNRIHQEGTRTTSNVATNTFTDSRGAEASLAAGRRLADIPGLRSMTPALRGLSANLFYAQRFGSRSQTTVAIQGTGTGDIRHSDTGNSYGVGMAFDRFKWLTVRARAGTSRRDNKDKLAADQAEDAESKSEGDTATVDVDVPKIGPIEAVKLSFRVNEGSDTTADLARSSTGGQTGVVGTYVLDTHSSLRQTVNLSMRYRQGPLTIGLAGDAGRSDDSYVIRANAFNETRRYGWRVDSKLDFWKGSALVAKYDNSKADINQDDKGYANASTRIDRSQKFYLEFSKPFTKTLNFRVYGDFQLAQAFHEHPGPQGLGDWDELVEKIGLVMNGAIGSNLKAEATLYRSLRNKGFIEPRRSIQSRDETEYVVRPSYSWMITPRVTLRQSFGLTSKVIEEIFAHDRDTLNRNHWMRTEMDARLTARLQMNLNWDYRIQDNGRYLNDQATSERFYSPTLRTKTDGLGVGMRYAVIPGDKLTFTSRQESQRIYNFGFTDGERQLRTITDSGNLALGFESRFQLRDLKLDCRVVRNRSFNVSLNRRVYYNVDATLSYAF